MTALFSIRSPALTTRAVLLVIVPIAASVLIFVRLVRPWIPSKLLLRDPLAVAMSAPKKCCAFYYGAVSLLGSLMWAASAAVCLLAWLIVRKAEPPSQRAFFFLMGFTFSLALCIDDTFMLHDTLQAKGIGERWGFAVLLLISIPYFYSARDYLYYRSGLMLVAAVALLAASVVLDDFMHVSYMAEDGPKFVGIVTWTVFHFSAVIEELHNGMPALGYGRQLSEAFGGEVRWSEYHGVRPILQKEEA